MRRIQLSIRVTRAQDAALRAYAASSGLQTRYQAAVRAIETGLNALVGQRPLDVASPDPEVADALGEILVRLRRVEGLADRSLYTSSAAYAYARYGALRQNSGAGQVDVQIADAAQEAYRRQKELAGDVR